MARQRRHTFEDKFTAVRENQESGKPVFNSDGVGTIGNPLLASWGKLGRDYIYLLSELENSRGWMRLLILRQIILHRIQADILELESHAVAGVNLEEYSRSDNSIMLDPRITASFSRLSQPRSARWRYCTIACLAMLKPIDANAARHLSLAVADIDGYSPFIEAIVW